MEAIKCGNFCVADMCVVERKKVIFELQNLNWTQKQVETFLNIKNLEYSLFLGRLTCEFTLFLRCKRGPKGAEALTDWHNYASLYD